MSNLFQITVGNTLTSYLHIQYSATEKFDTHQQCRNYDTIFRGFEESMVKENNQQL